MKLYIIIVGLVFSVYGHEVIGRLLINGNKDLGIDIYGREVNGGYSYSKIANEDSLYKRVFFKVARQNRYGNVNDTDYTNLLWFKDNLLINCTVDTGGVQYLQTVGDVFLGGVKRSDSTILVFRPNEGTYNFERVDSSFLVNKNHYSEIGTIESKRHQMNRNKCFDLFEGADYNYQNKYQLSLNGVKIGVDSFSKDYSKFFKGKYKRIKNEIETSINGVVELNGEVGDCTLKFTDIGILKEISVQFKPSFNYYQIKKYMEDSLSYLYSGYNGDKSEVYDDCFEGFRCVSLSREAMSMHIWMSGLNADELFYDKLKSRADSLKAYK